MSEMIDKLLDLLLDGEWHNIKELVEKMKIESEKLEKIIELLQNFNFLKYKNSKVRISADVKELIEYKDS
jgi:transcription initiation factor IIE alpha subunit